MDDEQMFPYAVILITEGAEVGRVLFEAADAESAEYEADGIMNRLVDEGFDYESYEVMPLTGLAYDTSEMRAEG